MLNLTMSYFCSHALIIHWNNFLYFSYLYLKKKTIKNIGWKHYYYHHQLHQHIPDNFFFFFDKYTHLLAVIKNDQVNLLKLLYLTIANAKYKVLKEFKWYSNFS